MHGIVTKSGSRSTQDSEVLGMLPDIEANATCVVDPGPEAGQGQAMHTSTFRLLEQIYHALGLCRDG